MRMTQRAIEIRQEIVAEAMHLGASEREIRAMAADARARELLNAMCQAAADAETGTTVLSDWLRREQ